MINSILALGYGLIVFAIIVGVGSVVLYNFGGSVGSCSNLPNGAWNATAGGCSNGSAGVASVAPVGTAYTNTNYVLTQLGSAGLSGWVPAIIAVSVGVLFLGMFMVGQGRRSRF